MQFACASRMLLPRFTYIRCSTFFSDSDVYRCILVCLFTHFSVYIVHIEISKTSYICEQREYFFLCNWQALLESDNRNFLAITAGNKMELSFPLAYSRRICFAHKSDGLGLRHHGGISLHVVAPLVLLVAK